MRKIPALLFSIFILSLFFIGCAPQKQTGAVKDGSSAFERKQYAVAADMLKKEFEKEKDQSIKSEKAFLIGESYRLANLLPEASDWYKQAVDLNYKDPKAIYWYAKMLKSEDKYEQAMEQFRKYGQVAPEKAGVANKELESIMVAMQWAKMKTKFSVQKMETINSTASDYAPTLYENKALVFSSARNEAEGKDVYKWTNENFSDLFISVKDIASDKYSAPEPFEGNTFNSDANEGTVTFNKDFTEMYFTRCFSKGDRDDFCQIYFSTRTAQKWSNPEPIPFFPDSCNVGHPRLSPDGEMLFLSSDAEGGFGGKDLYVCYRVGNGWGSPQNMGNVINTEGDEMYPFMHNDGSFFFASNGHKGMGGLDNFMAAKKGGGWGAVENLRPPMNSGADDFGIYFDEYEVFNMSGFFESHGFFSSTRSQGKGNDDIYRFTVEKPAFFALDGIVLEKIYERKDDPNSKIIDHKIIPFADVHLLMLDTTNNYIEVSKTQADEKGEFHFKLEPNTEYKVIGSAPEYFSKSEIVSTRGLKGSKNMAVTLTVEIILEKIYKEKEIVLPNIYYNYDKWNIREDAAKILDQLAVLLGENPGIRVEIGSHTDARGSTAYNEKLSQKRAESAVRYMISRGISKKRLEAKGYGESKLVNSCNDSNLEKCNEEEHQRNRRTTFKVLSDSFTLESSEPTNIQTDPEMLERQKKESRKKE